MKNLILIILAIFLATGCSKKQEQIPQAPIVEKDKEVVIEEQNENLENGMQKVSFLEIDGFFDDDLNHALEVFKKDCKKSKKYDEFRNVCKKAEFEKDGRKFFMLNFEPYKLFDSKAKDEGTITGYYEPLLYGSLKKSARYKYPIYKTPKNLIITDRLNSNGSKRGKIVKNKIVPYDTREQIEKNPKNKNLEPIAYVDDKFDLFFLHIQGSGKIKLDTGEIINVGYAEQNGWPYLSIGSYLIEKNYITKDEMSVQAMKDFFKANPKIMDEVFNSNPSYIFFRVSPNGATGALNTVLTAKRNLAVDRSYIPLGMPVFLSTKNPVTKEPLNQLMVAADVGGAIKGEIRADFFWGFGDDAFHYAGRMKEKGKMYILKPKY
ncbi:murein transglycosylase A [Aliarcobacter cibarius]|jgi:membrane-bound lytic murein transglycosylase A|uniref:peptidoglycan lytic exotransglycosylase n=1 Tax=Aliarcobacter cibarius TaxID=255507 RepID=A0A7L5JMB5_9BACT|nr:MltA domain-containing protein [Aliarcobacter cibarius]QKJ26363.1 membrane-bound lytic murein transglycosylase A [Aliarcobacter cibarius]TLT01852.1 peptidoglycan N-acetylmuramoylhydrolase [Aliarcobacter cibarius]TLT02187.1 peptidoglycan N-acetylmuramoylhydrolase [Aliarcobacter cibarius]TLT04617.1 peptidoglycan N-acetylmuramoylhydrolase [Aliarcobacter cibarius]